MGIRDRIKKRLSRAKDILSAASEEAKYPGRPQPHMAGRSPLWGGNEDTPPDGVQPQQVVPQPPPVVDPYATSGSRDEESAPGGGDFWFLKTDEDNEGWGETNPGKKTDEEGD